MNKPCISLIAALSENRVIGRNGEIPWSIPGEQRRFKEITTPHPIIIGRKTFESIGRLLPNRPNIIITRDESLDIEGAVVVHSLDEAIEKANELEKKRTTTNKIASSSIAELRTPRNDEGEEIFVIGGGKVFDEAIRIADKLYLTIVHGQFDGDAFFPEFTDFTKEVYREERENNSYSFTYLDLERVVK